MGLLLRAVLLAAIGTTGCLAAESALAQADNAPPAQGTGPAARPGGPAGTEVVPIVPPQPELLLPQTEPGPRMRGSGGGGNSRPAIGV
jgi:hypothetical protein